MATSDTKTTPLADDESLEFDFTAYLARELEANRDAVDRALGGCLLASQRMRKALRRAAQGRPHTRAA